MLHISALAEGGFANHN